MTLKYPSETGQYASANEYKPTETTIGPNGDIYVADGYGKSYVIQYNSKGEYIRHFGGKGDKEENIRQAHGVALDNRDKKNPTLLVTSREENALKRFTLDGKLLKTIKLPGAYVCRPVVRGQNVYASVLISHLPWTSGSGFVTILDKNDKVVSNPGRQPAGVPEWGIAENGTGRYAFHSPSRRAGRRRRKSVRSPVEFGQAIPIQAGAGVAFGRNGQEANSPPGMTVRRIG